VDHAHAVFDLEPAYSVCKKESLLKFKLCDEGPSLDALEHVLWIRCTAVKPHVKELGKTFVNENNHCKESVNEVLVAEVLKRT
jgi:hypothetical protein